MELSRLAPPRGAKKKRTRVGLGEGSGHGKTSGRGGKGQTARSGGGVRPGFEGGQMPLYRRIPKFGFSSRSKVLGKNSFIVVNLSDLEKFADGSVVDQSTLLQNGIKGGAHERAGYKVLGNGQLTKKLTVKVQAISASAKAKIEALGGTVEIVKLAK